MYISFFAQEINLLVSEESTAIIRHILMRSFDAVYRMDGKTFRAFVSQEFCGGQASNVYSKLYSISIFHRRMFSARCLWHQHPYRSRFWNVFFTFSDVALAPSFVSRRAYSPLRRLTKDQLLRYRSYNGNGSLQFYSHKFYSTPIFYFDFKMHVIRNQLGNYFSARKNGMKSIHAMH